MAAEVFQRLNLLPQSLRNTLLCSRLLSSQSATPPPPAGPYVKDRTRGDAGDSLTEPEQYIPAPRRGNFWKLKQQRYRKHISDLVKKSRQNEAVKLLEQMKKGRVGPDEVTYNTILSGYAKQGDVSMAFKTFNEVS